MLTMQEEIKNALKVLRKGGIILYPTDTIWGIGCDATNAHAVDKVYEIKKRSEKRAMLVLVDSADRVWDYVNEVPEIAEQLAAVSDKPLTIVYPEAIRLASNLVPEDKTIGIRITSDPFCQQLIKKFNKAIVSTSANVSGTPHPEHFSDIDTEIKQAVDYIVNCRQNDKNSPAPSSVIKIGLGGQVEILRK